MFEYAEAAGYITIEQEETEDGFTRARFIDAGTIAFDESLFTEEELATLNQRASSIGSKPTKEVVALSHQEKAWKKYVEGRELINYLEAFEMGSI